MNATMKDLKDTELVVSEASPFNSFIWPVQKVDGTWRITVEHLRLNQI